MKYLILPVFLLITSCANYPANNKGESLINWFKEYKSYYQTSSEANYFSPPLWSSIKKARTNNKASAFVSTLSKFPNEIIEITDYKETISGKTGCLLVSGKNSNKTPLDYYLSYKLNDSKWVIEDITVKYFFDGTKRFLTEAVCDEEKRAQLWLEFIEQKE